MGARKMLRLCVVCCAAAVLANAAPMVNTTGTRILIMGDSWGTISPATEHFQAELKEHNCPLSGFTNIAVGGTTAKQWSGLLKMIEVKKQAKLHDHIWITLMGNDALEDMPGCASSGKTAAQCGDVMMVNALERMGKILDGIHDANPDAKVVGFGYDTMFGGFGCGLVTRSMFPQCYRIGGGGNRCFNTQFLRIQAVWD